MNAYAVRTSDEINLGGGGDFEPDEYGCIYEVVIAKSPSHARAIVTSAYDLEFTSKLQIRKLADDVEMPEGTVMLWGEGMTDEIALFVHASALWHSMTDAEEFYQWQSWYDAVSEVQS